MKKSILFIVVMLFSLYNPVKAHTPEENTEQSTCRLLITFNMNWSGNMASGRYYVPQECYTIESVNTRPWIRYIINDGYINFSVTKSDWEANLKPLNMPCTIYFTDGTSHTFDFVFEGGTGIRIPDPDIRI